MTIGLKKQLLEFLELAELERNRLLERCETGSAEQQQIEMALCHTEDAISITSAEGNIRLINPAFEQVTGYHGSELIGTNHRLLWVEKDHDRIEAMNHKTSSGYDWQGELSLKSKSGTHLDVQVAVVPIIHHTGRITHLVYTLHDITRRMQLEKYLKQQKQFLEKVINLNPSIIILLDENGEWMLDNLAAKTLLSDLGEGARKTLSALLLAGMKRLKQTGSTKIALSLPNGSQRSYMLFGEQIPARYLIPESEQKGAFLITLSDITEIEKKNQEILVRQKALLASRVEKNLIQGEFINGFIYQVQQPLNLVKAAISRMQVAMKQQRVEQIGQSMLLLNRELESLENELTKFRTMQQSYPKHAEVTEAWELAEAIKILFGDHYQVGRILCGQIPETTVIYPFPYEIMQLLLKIMIDNALEASGETANDAPVTVEFRKGINESLLSVADSGPGIAKKDRYKVFEPFYSTKPNHLGLSLTIVHQLLNNIGGGVELSGSELGGLKMTLFFPLELS